MGCIQGASSSVKTVTERTRHCRPSAAFCLFNLSTAHILIALYPAGPWKQLLDTSRDITFSVEVDDARRAAYKRASSSVKTVTERIRRDRANAGSMMMSSTLGPFGGSIGGFASQVGSIGAKVSASQYSLGKAHPSKMLWEEPSKMSQTQNDVEGKVKSSVSAIPICDKSLSRY